VPVPVFPALSPVAALVGFAGVTLLPVPLLAPVPLPEAVALDVVLGALLGVTAFGAGLGAELLGVPLPAPAPAPGVFFVGTGVPGHGAVFAKTPDFPL
jgi:hypothetical protein